MASSPSRAVRGVKSISIPPPVAGVNIATSVDKLQETEAEQLRGYEFDEYGTLGAPRSPKDLGQVHATATPLSGVIFQRTGGATQLIVHLSDGSLRYSTDFLSTNTTATWTTIATGLSTTQPFDYAVFLDKVWMGNGVDAFRAWDGTTQTTYATAPKGKYLALWKDTLWTAGDPANPHRIYQCAPGDPTTWPALNFIDIDKGAGLGISAIFASEAALVVARPKRTSIIFDPVEYTNRVLDNDKGVVANNSVVSHSGVYYFVSHLGVCKYLGDGPSEIVSDKIAPLFNDIYAFGSALATPIDVITREAQIWGYSYENYVGWFLPLNNVTNYIKYFPDLPDKPWVFGYPVGTQPAGSVSLSVREPGKFQQLYRIANGSGSTSRLFRDYGGLITDAVICEWRTGWFDFDSELAEKYIDAVEVLHRGTISLTFNRDFLNEEQGGEDSEVQAAAITSPQVKLTESIVWTDYYARQLQLVINSSTPAEMKQFIASGVQFPAYATRFQSAIARIIVHARLLQEYRR